MVEDARLKKCIIIGYGNTLRGDDGLGPHIVEGLYDWAANSKIAVDLRTMPQLDITLSTELCSADLTIFVDARVDGDDDLVKVEKIEPVDEFRVQNHTSHTISIPGLLRIMLNFYKKAPLCYLVAPKGFNFSISEDLSDRAKVAASIARDKIIELLTE